MFQKNLTTAINVLCKKTSRSCIGTRYYSRGTLPTNTIIKFVPQQEAWIVERMGKYSSTLEGGLAILLPFIDTIKYTQTLKEVALGIPYNTAITSDNVTIKIDGVLYYKIVDPYKASYGIEDPQYAVTQLAQTPRSEIGMLSLDKTLSERTLLNTKITETVNQASKEWGIKCLRYRYINARYEIKDIQPPENVVASMHQQVSAERKKRAEILESEAYKLKLINQAQGESESITLKATANANAISLIAQTLQKPHASEALSLGLAEKYIEAFGGLAKEGNTLIVPANVGDVGGFVASAMKIVQNCGIGGNEKMTSLKVPGK